ncbi:ABC transporter permease [Paenibacillus hodogayensis]|uniref:ABC transporter permease n=1 Tax=Paenibacillus hodogayensis TaxID=279208 RepID=A0ABV5VPF0_9BACL
MLNVFYAELLKLKRTRLLWLTIFGGSLPAILAIFGQSKNMNWNELLINNSLFLNIMIAPMLLSLLAGFVVVREFGDNTINQLFVYPHHRVKILIGKMIVILLLSTAIFALNYVLIWAAGSVMSDQVIPEELFWRFTRAHVWMLALQALLIPATMTVGIMGKSFIPPVVLGIVAILINMMGLQGVEDHIGGRVTFVSFIPFGSMIVHLLDIMKSNVDDGIFRIHALYPQAAVFLLFFLFNMFYYAKSEVHSGS